MSAVAVRNTQSISPLQRELDVTARISYVHSSFGSISLPRSRVPERRYAYAHDGAHIQIDAGSLWDGQVMRDQIIPYGVSARLIQAYLVTYAVRHRTPIVPLCKNVSAFVEEVRGYTTGGKRGTIGPVVEQLKAIAACNMTVGVNIFESGRSTAKTTQIRFSHEFDGLLVAEGTRIWPKALRLTDDYYESCRNHALPLDLNAIKMVSRSAMAIDILYYLAGRLPRVKTMEMVRWSKIKAQFAGNNMESPTFKRYFIRQLELVKQAYPQARIEPTTEGLVMKVSEPMIPRQGVVITAG